MRPHRVAPYVSPSRRSSRLVLAVVVALVATLTPLTGSGAAATDAGAGAGMLQAPRPRSADELAAERIVERLHAEARVEPTRFVAGAKEPPAPPLEGWTDLREVARGWSDRMASDGRLAHNPDYSTQICCWSAVAENVAWVGGVGGYHTVETAAEALTRSLLTSDPHRASMLSATYHEVGIGVSIRGDRMYATVNLRQRRDGPTAPGTSYALPTATDPSIRHACPRAPSLPQPFRDVGGGAHGQPIACAVAWGIVTGRTAHSYDPARPVTRAQVATMLRRLLEASGARLDPDRRVRFTDVHGGPHAEAIALLAGAGIVQGVGDGRFAPEQPVRRDQVASLLVRSLERVHGITPPLGPSFPDVGGGAHGTAVRRLVGAGITRGDDRGRFDPAGSVRRDQMATFAARTADLLVRGGHVTPPAAARG